MLLGLEDLNDLIIYKLRTMDKKELSNVADVGEGLENLIIEEALKTNKVEELVKNVKSKRYTQSRIQRIVLMALLNGLLKRMLLMLRK